MNLVGYFHCISSLHIIYIIQFLSLPLSEVEAHVVVDVAAAVGREGLRLGHHEIPQLGREATLDMLAAHTVAYQPVDEPGVEIVARPYRAHRLRRRHGILALQRAVGPEHHGACALRVDELLAVERYFGVVDAVGTIHVVKHLEVFARPAHDVGILQVLDEVRRDAHHIVAMRGAEVHVIVDDGPMAAGMVEQPTHLRAQRRVHGIIGAEEHDVVGLDVGVAEVELVVGLVAVEDVLRIVVLVEERQRHGRLRPREYAHIVGIHAVLPQEVDDILAHAVAACLGDERAGHARATQRHDSVVGGAAGHGPHGLVVPKNDVEHGLADAYYFSHDCME